MNTINTVLSIIPKAKPFWRHWCKVIQVKHNCFLILVHNVSSIGHWIIRFGVGMLGFLSCSLIIGHHHHEMSCAVGLWLFVTSCSWQMQQTVTFVGLMLVKKLFISFIVIDMAEPGPKNLLACSQAWQWLCKPPEHSTCWWNSFGKFQWFSLCHLPFSWVPGQDCDECRNHP